MKLIKLKTDHYVIVDDSEIKKGDYALSKLNEIVVFGKNYTPSLYKKITHSTEPIEDYTRVDGITIKVYVQVKSIYLYEVKELLGVVDVEKKILKLLPDDSQWQDRILASKIYNQALEDNKEKKYTEEDLKKMFDIGEGLSSFNDTDDNKFKYALKHIQPKTEWEVEFIDGKLTLKQ